MWHLEDMKQGLMSQHKYSKTPAFGALDTEIRRFDSCRRHTFDSLQNGPVIIEALKRKMLKKFCNLYSQIFMCTSCGPPAPDGCYIDDSNCVCYIIKLFITKIFPVLLLLSYRSKYFCDHFVFKHLRAFNMHR